MPAPAITRTYPSVASTASRWAAFKGGLPPPPSPAGKSPGFSIICSIRSVYQKTHRCSYINWWNASISTGTSAEQMTPLSTESTTVSPFVQRMSMGSVVSSLVAPAGAMHVG